MMPEQLCFPGNFLKTRSLFFSLFIFIYFPLTSFLSAPVQYDVCVYGGTSAGVIAAYAAVKMGKRVILIEPGKHLGGLTTGGLGYTDIGNKYAITGLSRDFYRRLGKHYRKFEQWIFEPGAAEDIFNEYIRLGKVQVLFGHRITSASKTNAVIREIRVENTFDSKSAVISIGAKMFIDCSYEGDLMAKAGVSYTTGREANNLYNETYNGVQLMQGHQFPDGIDPYKIPGDRSSGLLWGISDEHLLPAGTGDKKIQAYNYRICLTDDPKNKIPIDEPAGYDPSKYELFVRLLNAQPNKKTLNDYFFFGPMPNRKTDINNRGGFSTDMIGMNYNYPDGSYNERISIIKQHEAYVKGLLYFVGHDPRVPEQLRNEMLQWGYPKDEFTDNGHWSPQLYIREARRMIGSYVMTQANCQGRVTVDDGVGMAAYTMDSHNCERIVVNGMVKNEGNVEVGGFGPYPVSYRAIIPKENECKNLFVPVCLSASHIAYGSIRMEPVFMVLAQSAAIAASMAIDNKQNVQQVDVKKIQQLLVTNPLLDNSVPEVLADNDDKEHVRIMGDWKRQTSGGYGPSYLIAAAGNGEASVQLIPVIKTARIYSLYAYFPKTANAAGKIPVVVFDGKTSKQVFINLSALQVEGQTSGEWVSLGSYALPKGEKASVTISNKNAGSNVVADAVLFVPVK